MYISILKPLQKTILSFSTLFFIGLSWFFSYYFLSDLFSLKDFFIFYSSALLSSIIFLNDSNFKRSINERMYNLPLNLIISAFFSLFPNFFGDYNNTLPISYFFLFLFNIIMFYSLFKKFKYQMFFNFFKNNNLKMEDFDLRYYKTENLLSHKLFFNKNKKRKITFKKFKFIKNFSKLIAGLSLFYYSYLIYLSHFDLIFIVGVPFLSIFSYYVIKKLLLVLYFILTPIRLFLNNFYYEKNYYYIPYDCNGIAVLEDDDIKVIESKFTEFFNPILIYQGKEINIPQSVLDSFNNKKDFLSFLKKTNFFKNIEKYNKIDNF